MNIASVCLLVVGYIAFVLLLCRVVGFNHLRDA